MHEHKQLPATALPATTDRSSSRLYARVWRWHFFAALIVIPFVLWQAATGVLYLWSRELVQFTHPELMTVRPDPAQASYEAQLAGVLVHHPRDRLAAIEISDAPSDTTMFFFRDDNGLTYPAFSNPHTGAYLGALSSFQWVASVSRGLHGGWPVKPYGSYVLELGACWTIVMVLSGMYLWWPQHARGLAGVLYPRLRSGSRIFWRDVHATVGIYFSVLFLLFLFTALPWTSFWGERVLAPIESLIGQASPLGFFFASGPDHHHSAAAHQAEHKATHSGHPLLTLDQLVARVRAEGLRRRIELHPHGDGQARVNARDEHARSRDEVWLQLDAHSGAVLTKVTWPDFPPLARAVALGVDLHEGKYFGRINQIFNTVVALALVWLAVTGFIGWYRRRPQGGFAAPPRQQQKLPLAAKTGAMVLCVVLPMLAGTLVVLLLLERAFGKRSDVRTR